MTLPPPSIKTFDIRNTGVEIDVAAIEWPANATALVYNGYVLVCSTTDPDESKEGAATSEIRITCNADQVIGDIGNLVLPEGMQTVNFVRCTDLTGNITQLNLPVGIQEVNFNGCTGLGGTLVTFPPSRMTIFDIRGTSAKVDVASIELPASATALKQTTSVRSTGKFDALVCSFANEGKEGAEATDIVIACDRGQVVGDFAQLRLPTHMEELDLTGTAVTGDVTQLQLPVSMINLSLGGEGSEVTGDVANFLLPEGMEHLDIDTAKNLTGDVTQMRLPKSMRAMSFKGCERIGGDVGKFVIPKNMQNLNLDDSSVTGDIGELVPPDGTIKNLYLHNCSGITGTLATLSLDETGKLDISGTSVIINTTYLKLPVTTTSLVFSTESRDTVCGMLVCVHGGVNTSITCSSNQVIGDIAELVLHDGMKVLNFEGCEAIIGDATQLQLPASMEELVLKGTQVNGKKSDINRY